MATRRTGCLALAVLALASLAGCTHAPESRASFSLVGAWRAHVQFSGGVLATVKDLEFLYVFNQGGTLTESSNYDGAPPVPPAYGEWRQVAAGGFEAKYSFWTTNPPADVKLLASGAGWPPSGWGVLTERITPAADGRSYDSALTLELFDKSGRPVSGGGTATVHAKRAGF
jgi:hypothetical protein